MAPRLFWLRGIEQSIVCCGFEIGKNACDYVSVYVTVNQSRGNKHEQVRALLFSLGQGFGQKQAAEYHGMA